ncbi:MAG: dicarboxylate/amino acid:cation symporter [Planctomycetes bacterium]|nr:dicarboxylate/amino acid:cation symporter [Planctomycetota bacterium]
MKRPALATWILVGLIAGLACGLAACYLLPADFNAAALRWVLRPVGELFLRAITLMVVPIVLVSLTYGAASVGDPRKLGRVGLKVMGIFIGTTVLAMVIALALAEGVVRPGQSIQIPTDARYAAREAPFVMDVVVNLVPRNPLKAMVDAEMLQLIVLALLVGVALAQVGPKARPVLDFLGSLNDALMRAIEIILYLAPPGVFALIAKVMIEQGVEVLLPLLAYVLTLAGALALQAAVVYPLLLALVGRVSPLRFYRNHFPAMTVAFSTSSSNATLPVNLEVTETRNGVSKSVAGFVLPLGATINMDGTAIMQGVATAFIAQVYGIGLSWGGLATVVLTATLASIGTAGVPGVGLVTLSMVLASVNLPVEGIALVIGVDRILDMLRTVVNITGDAVAAVVVAKSEGEWDRAVFERGKG